MRNQLIHILLLAIVFSCNKNSNNPEAQSIFKKDFDDQNYVIAPEFKKGDIRRYGISPEIQFSNKQWERVLELAQKDIPITFNKGTYYGNLIFKGVDSINIHFNDVTITGGLQIIDDKGKSSQNIALLGQLTVLDKVFIRQSSAIRFNKLQIVSDTVNNIYRKKNRGLSIYAGSKRITVDTLLIQDTGGSKDDFYTLSAAAMQVHGYNDNPEEISIKYLKIINAARSGLYLTGNNHKIQRIEIENFGFGSNDNMFGLEDAKPNAQKKFSGTWFNKCNDCTIDTLSILAYPSNKTFSAKFGLGVYSKPCIINNITFTNYAKKLPIEDDILTNVLVKHVLKND